MHSEVRLQTYAYFLGCTLFGQGCLLLVKQDYSLSFTEHNNLTPEKGKQHHFEIPLGYSESCF